MKYYQPKLDEFGINFEYEVNTGDKWEKRILQHTTSLHNIKILLNKGSIRVCKLDKPIIESLGWNTIFGIKDTYEISDGYYKLFKYSTSECWNIRANSKHVFKGILKNKSELAKLMVQLNIK